MARHLLLFAGFAALLFSGIEASATECPSTVYYSNGQRLKSGSTFYYSNGQRLKSGSTLYYSNGQRLKSGSTIYYPNGQRLRSGSTIYYNNGQRLKSGSTYYYSNGQRLKSGSTFYHANGQRARSGSTLYTEDGRRTQFPQRLTDNLQGAGELSAYVASNSEDIKVKFLSLQPGVGPSLVYDGNGDSWSNFKFDLDAGDGYVLLTVDEDSFECTLVGGGGGGGDPTRFTLSSPAGRIDVEINPAYDAEEARRLLQEALDAIPQ